MAFNHVHVGPHNDAGIQWTSPEFAQASPRGSSSCLVVCLPNKDCKGAYGDAVVEMDWVVGQILDALRESKLDQETLVFVIPFDSMKPD